MANQPSVLRDLQEAVSDRLRTAAWRGEIQVLDRRDGTIDSKIDEALAGLGVTIFVSPVMPRGFSANVPTPTFDNGAFIVRIIDNPVTNSTGLDAYALAELIISRLHHFVPGVPGAGPITVDPDPIDDSQTTKKRTVWELLFHISGSFEAGAL